MHRSVAEWFAKARIVIEKLGSHHLAGHNETRLRDLGSNHRFVMQLIAWVEQGNPVACICENPVYALCFEVP